MYLYNLNFEEKGGGDRYEGGGHGIKLTRGLVALGLLILKDTVGTLLIVFWGFQM